MDFPEFAFLHFIVGILSGIVYHYSDVYFLNIFWYTVICAIWSVCYYLLSVWHITKNKYYTHNSQQTKIAISMALSVLLFLLLVVPRYVTSLIISLCVVLFPHLTITQFLKQIMHNFF